MFFVARYSATALIWAAADLRKVKLLVAHKADVNAASKAGHTPLLVAALSDRSFEIVKLLISKGADIKAVDNQKTIGRHDQWISSMATGWATKITAGGANVDLSAPCLL